MEEVSDKVIEKIREGQSKAAEEAVSVAASESNVDYDRIIYGAAEKVIESLPYPDKIDYARIDDSFLKAAETLKLRR